MVVQAQQTGLAGAATCLHQPACFVAHDTCVSRTCKQAVAITGRAQGPQHLLVKCISETGLPKADQRHGQTDEPQLPAHTCNIAVGPTVWDYSRKAEIRIWLEQCPKAHASCSSRPLLDLGVVTVAVLAACHQTTGQACPSPSLPPPCK